MKYAVQQSIFRKGEPFAGPALRASISRSTYRTHMYITLGGFKDAKSKPPKKEEVIKDAEG